MNTPMKTSPATRRAAAQPSASLAADLVALHDLANAAHDTVAYQVAPLLRAAENLADCRRTLDLLRTRAELSPAFAAQVRDADPAYLNHLSEYDGFELIQELLRVAVNLLADSASCMERVGPAALVMKDQHCGPQTGRAAA